ncbi:Acetylornithine aminotransferase [Sinobacterium norvegicum]|uniref:Acetylornithine aminotransferase n=2 Tax=Sinobacterium norvegicum TaxID=1641715 RepID=A0ABN8EQT4_9GAMM|nr:Acetylornithine aminotransferase [Sinobacterium norvegicum]
MTTAIMNTYGRLAVNFVKGEDCYLFDQQGNRFIDALSGIGTCNVGHCHPRVTEAISQQAATLVHTSNLYHITPQIELAEKLTRISGMDNVFFANSGAESNEAAIKIARLYGHQHHINKPAILVMEHSFHGRTLATLSATGNSKIQQGFGPLVEGFIRVPYDNIEAVKAAAEQHDNIVAILLEPVQGEGGLHIPSDDYLTALRQICDQQQWLLMLDEVQTGNGRTGKYFAFQHTNIKPDVVTTAKGLGNGVPIGACIAGGKANGIFAPGNHGSTFGGNPLACAAANAVITTIEQDELCANATAMGNLLNHLLSEALASTDGVVEIRNKGLMIGIELNRDCPELVQQALDNHLLINVTAGNVIRLLPPLTINQQTATKIVEILTPLIQAHLCT